jgi:hypothetical protein
MPTGVSQYNQLSAIEIEFYNSVTQQWELEYTQDPDYGYYNILPNRRYRLALVWVDVLRGVSSRETDGRVYVEPIRPYNRMLGITSRFTPDVSTSTTNQTNITRVNIFKEVCNFESTQTPQISSRGQTETVSITRFVPTKVNCLFDAITTPQSSRAGGTYPDVVIARVSGISVGT